MTEQSPTAPEFDVDPAAKLNCCPACGAHFRCGMNAGLSRCWCAEFPPVLPLPALPSGSVVGCLCPDCLEKRIADAAPQWRGDRA